MKPEEILYKEPFKRIEPYIKSAGTTNNGDVYEPKLPSNSYTIIPQEKFLAELHPSGHMINLRQDKEIRNKQGQLVNFKPVAKIAVALQQIISTKQKIHLATNQLKWTLTESDRTDKKEAQFVEFKQTWIDKNMHVALSEVIESWLDTGDGALYYYRDNGKLNWTDFSFKKGDVLLPKYDNYGNLIAFGRMYKGIDAKGKEITKLDIFDDKIVSTFYKKGFLDTGVSERWVEIKEARKAHGFSTVPICYIRSDDVAWGAVQPLIDSFEEALSNMSENNRYYANMILFLKGNIQDLPDRDQAGKVLVGKEDADAKFLATPESNEAQAKEIDILLKQIFMGSFTVTVSPDTVKSSGDLPGITVKLLFSPATEKALNSAKKLDSFIDRMVMLFKEGYGLESNKYTYFKNLRLRGEIDIYVPENTEEFTRMLNESLTYGSISQQTAAEKNRFAVNGEYDRIKEEKNTVEGGTFLPPPEK